MSPHSTSKAQVLREALDLAVAGVMASGLDAANGVVMDAAPRGDHAKLSATLVKLGLDLREHVGGFGHAPMLRHICLFGKCLCVNAHQADVNIASSDDFHMRKATTEVLAANLAALRERPGMPKSQAEIAAKSGVDQTTVSRTLRASNALSVDKLDGLARAFGVKPWHLIAPGLVAQMAGLSPKALEVALLYEGLASAKQAHLYATAQMLHNPDAEPEQPSPPLPAPPVGQPSRKRVRGT